MNYDLTSITNSLAESTKYINDNIPTKHMWSDTQFEIIKKYIREYENTLNEDEEIALKLTQFGQSMVMQVYKIICEKSVTLVFEGFVNGEKSVLVQHINQLNFLITKVKKQSLEPRRQIGFYET